MKFKNVNIPKKDETAFFHINSASRTMVGNKTSEFVQEKIVELSLIDFAEDSLVFKYNLKAQKMEGTAIIHHWTSDMDNLQANLYLVTDLKGNFKDILYFEDLYKKWDEGFSQNLSTKYADFQPGLGVMLKETRKLLQNKKEFIKNFIGYSSWRFFFQSWYREYETEEETPLLLKGYFGKIDLPLDISSKSFISENKFFIERKADLNAAQFDRKSFARMLKDLTNVYNIDASLKIELEEKYEMSNDGWLQEAELFLETSVNNWYSIATAHQLKRMETEEFLSFIEQISATKTKENIIE